MQLLLVTLLVAAASAKFIIQPRAPAPVFRAPAPVFRAPASVSFRAAPVTTFRSVPRTSYRQAAPVIRAPVFVNTEPIFKTVQRDCVYQDWSQWSPCNAQCDQIAYQQRTRSILKEASGYGQQCDQSSLVDQQQCQGAPCPRDCVMTNWSEWTACSANCDQGERQRWRQIQSNPSNGGAQCGNLDERESCNNGPCAVDCQMSSWSQYSDCSAPCGEGRRQRLRAILVQPQNGGLACGPLEEWERCNNGPCAVDCQMSSWSEWSDCSAPCDEGRRQRLRAVLVQPQNGGQQCGPQEEWSQCNNGPCAQDCAYDQWQSWSQCPSCGQATRSRGRSILQQGLNGGVQCDFGSLAETESCNNRPCAVDCQMSFWSQWSDCSAQCEEGRRQRLRTVLTQPQFGGLACGPQEEWERCNNGPCPQDCALDQWQSWSQCPSCGQASRSRQRSILVQGANGGIQCDFGSLAESEQCPFISCAVDCQVSSWTQYSACSADCGSGSQQRTRAIITRPANGGELCPELEEWRKCSNGPCQQEPRAYAPAPFRNPAPAPAPVIRRRIVARVAPRVINLATSRRSYSPTFSAPVVRFTNPGPARVFSSPSKPAPPTFRTAPVFPRRGGY